MGDVGAFAALVGNISQVCIFVIPVKQVVELGIGRSINAHRLRRPIALCPGKRFHGTGALFFRAPHNAQHLPD